MKSAFFIMILWQTGNVGSCNIKKLNDNPENGYLTYGEAQRGMANLKDNYTANKNPTKSGWELNQQGYQFAIMEIFESI